MKSKKNFSPEQTEQQNEERTTGQESEESQDLEHQDEALEQTRKERDEYRDLLLRKHAEFENYRKRVMKEKEEGRLAGQAEVVSEVLTVLDACQKGLEALDAVPDSPELGPYRDGYQLLHKQIVALLSKFGVTQVPGPGNLFDPNVHEAVIRETSTNHEEGKILDEYRRGYMIKDRLLRPAQVKVAVRPEEVPASE
jgi:molecular chaperone GrpE